MFYIYNTTARPTPRRSKAKPQPTTYYCRHLHNYYKLKLHELEAGSFEERAQARLEQGLAEKKKMLYWYRQEGFDLKAALEFKSAVANAYEFARAQATAGK